MGQQSSAGPPSVLSPSVALSASQTAASCAAPGPGATMRRRRPSGPAAAPSRMLPTTTVAPTALARP
eukprot:6827223-Alexandrium_andersonii.AAC.1